MISLPRRGYTLVKVTFAFIVVFGALSPGVVSQFVIIPNANKGMALMKCLKIRIRAIETITHPVIFKRNNLVLRHHTAFKYFPSVVIRVPCLGVLVDVIAQMKHQVQITFGHVPISVEETLRVVGARGDADGEFSRQTTGQRLRCTSSTADTARIEAIEVTLVWL